ncbi:hypothetical protein BJ875DRAFT_197923 [Amylocarpus encephaloides]|uniref:UBC core domain-containing protein n=1 Tax=Amylocarpus encephaloides TaxID=45428 RepID=A0A9P8C122_9HELO|nr:hypothetical protein BJ875DRAFT_197923 [Amylocarpus encephaloides]
MANGNSAPQQQLRKRLLQDIAELQTMPYPNTALYVQGDDLSAACLVLTVEAYGDMHLTVEFPSSYPLSPPTIKMNSDISHPNIFGDYICASILNTTEGYTPAYTLKAIAIQLLSFFSSENIEQVGGGQSVDLAAYRGNHQHLLQSYECYYCQYPKPRSAGQLLRQRLPPTSGLAAEHHWPSLGERASEYVAEASTSVAMEVGDPPCYLVDAKLPDEIPLLLCERLDTEDMMAFAQAWSKIGKVVTNYDVIRTRELQCFCFKTDYMSTNLGVGVSLTGGGAKKTIESEFDLLSEEGYKKHQIRRSVQGLGFDKWLPLPISEGHWRRVRNNAIEHLGWIAAAANLGDVKSVQVVYHFMNDVVVKLNQKASAPLRQGSYYPYSRKPSSTLTYASEKAIESYFHLFHLLSCLATEDKSIIQSANDGLKKFIGGTTSKEACPNVGLLLVAVLISDVEMTQGVLKSIIKETIIRNVVWMLDKKGANRAELAYMEPSAMSKYRLKTTFEAGKTSYRLLMFLNLFRATAVGRPRQPLAQLRDEAFARHGAPPRGSAKGLANSIKKIHEVNNFPDFFVAMGLPIPGAENFTEFLRRCIEESIKNGYSSMPVSQNQALWLRQRAEPRVEIAQGVNPMQVDISRRDLSFFPHHGRPSAGRRGFGRGQGDYGGRGGY